MEAGSEKGAAAPEEQGLIYGKLDVVPIAERTAIAEALRDRELYRPFMEVIEAFILRSKAELVVGGKSATRLLLRHPQDQPPLDAYSIELFSGAAYHYARQLADALYAVAPDSIGHYTRLDSYSSGAQITVNGRTMVKIQALPVHKGSSLADVVIPTLVPAEFVKGDVPCMGPEVQLIETYRALCDPSQAVDWADLIRDEKRLRQKLLGEMKRKIGEAVGGRERGPKSPARTAYADFRAAVINQFARGTGRVLVGRASFDPVAATRSNVRIQIVTANRLSEEAGDLTRLASTHSVKIETKINDPKVPIDPKLLRLTGHVKLDDGKSEAFIDIFNTGYYELVPWVDKAGFRVGTEFVLMRFRLVDLWTVQLLIQMKKITTGFARNVLFEALRDYERVSESLDRITKGPGQEALHRLFPFLQGAIGDKSGFVGHWEDATVTAKRRDLAQRRGGQPVYYPAANKSTRDTEKDTEGDIERGTEKDVDGTEGGE